MNAKMIVLSGPSGVGKSSIIKRILAKYPDMYSNFLPLEGKMIKSITIHYNNEAIIGEKLRVSRAKIGEDYFFRTVRADGKVNSEAKIELADI